MYKQDIEKGIELLKLCSKLQSEKDGVDRPEPLVIDKSKVLDQFARDVSTSITYMSSLFKKLIPMMENLTELGRKLEKEGKIEVSLGQDYSIAALNFVMSEHGMTPETTQE
jgi:regulator of PEP synthase PpsR (kinase-PPPase family)